MRDNGPFYFTEQEGDFEASVKITGAYKELFHQAGLMVRIDNKNWIKTGIEYVDGAAKRKRRGYPRSFRLVGSAEA
ncbi:DUF1349 domain-containing protein [Mucilaginibacter sp. UC70_90]